MVVVISVYRISNVFYTKQPQIFKNVAIFIFCIFIFISIKDHFILLDTSNNQKRSNEISTTIQIPEVQENDNPIQDISIVPISLDKDINVSHKINFHPQYGNKEYGGAGIKFVFSNENGIDITNYKRIQLDLDIQKDLSAELYIIDIGGNRQKEEKLKNGKNNLFISDISQNKIKLTNIESILISVSNQNKKPNDWLRMEVRQLKFIK